MSIDRCTCDHLAVDEAEQDPFCLVDPAPLEVLLGWLADWHVGRAEPPGPAELVRLCVILVRLGGFAIPGDSRDADITNDRLGLLGDAEVARLLADLEEPTS